jgi:peroxiredoxin
MSARDPLTVLLGGLDRRLQPRPQFAEALRARLLAELAQPDGLAVRRFPRPGLTLVPPWRRTLLAGAVALAIAAAAITTVVLSRPAPASAIDVIRQARRAFATAPPFTATLQLNLNPNGSERSMPKGATAIIAVSYDAHGRFRSELVSEQPRLRSGPTPGSYEVFDGQRIATYDPNGKILFSAAAPHGFRPLEFLSWHAAYPNWDRICSGRNAHVLPETQIAGRRARHIRCVNFTGQAWQLWIDRHTGLLLKIVGPIGNGDLFFGLGLHTSASGGFQIKRLRYNPSFPAGTFAIVAPPGARNFQADLQTAIATVPPFHAVFSARYGRAGPPSYSDETWWLNEQTWQRKVLVDRPTDPRGTGGAGSFFVYTHGQLDSYNARDNSYNRTSSPAFEPLNPIVELLPQADLSYAPGSCPIVGHTTIAGRNAIHRRCAPSRSCPVKSCRTDYWLDSSTGLILRRRSPTFALDVRSIRYHPHFPAEILHFVAPSGARSAQQLANSPYYKTKLTPGTLAPNWHATLLGGGSFQPSDLRGKPALLLQLPDWCNDPACNVLAPLEQAYQQQHTVKIIWIDFQGTPAHARKIVNHNHLTFTVVIDPKGSSIKSWAIQAFPYWLLLDRHGRVIEARLKPQTVAQLQQLITKAK